MAAKLDMVQMKRWLSPEGYHGLDEFLEMLPARVSKISSSPPASPGRSPPF